MTSPTRPVALVTGASSGIGADLARELARDGHDLVLTARRQAPMEALAAELKAWGATSVVTAADLSRPGAAAELANAIETRGLMVEVLVNNAGLGAIGRFDQTDPVRISEMLQVNIVALTELTRLLLPGMVARGNGGLFRRQSLCAEPRRSARRGIARHRRHGDDPMSRSHRHQFRPNFREQRTPVF